VKHQETELTSLKSEQQRVVSVLSQKDAELAQAAAEIERMRHALEAATTEARNNQQNRPNQQANQTDAEEQARILTSLSQAYLNINDNQFRVILTTRYNQLQERLQAKEDEVAMLTKLVSGLTLF
jgi:hypothetical protein